jgi:hypothetical protein
MNDMERFWSKVAKSDGCWLWAASLDKRGYGQFAAGSRTTRDRRIAKAHRLAWEYTFGPIPDGMHVCHRCDVRHCVNPAHLFLGTNSDNIADRVAKGRSPQGESRWNAKLTEGDVRECVRMFDSGAGDTEVARRFRVRRETVRQIRRGRTWRHVTGKASAV